MLVEIKKHNDEVRRIYFVDGLVDLGVDEDNEWTDKTEETFTKGFWCNEEDRWYADWEDVENFTVIEDYKELKTVADAYGTGYDKIVAEIDGDVWNLEHSRWQGHTHYMTYHNDLEE